MDAQSMPEAVATRFDPADLRRSAEKLHKDAMQKRREEQEKRAEKLLAEALSAAQKLIQEGQTQLDTTDNTSIAVANATQALKILKARDALEKAVIMGGFDDIEQELTALSRAIKKS